MGEYTPVAVFVVLGIGFVVMVLGISSLLRPHNPRPEKLTTYECGERPIGQAWSQFNVRYYIFALMFVVFDVETVFLFPWALRLGWFAQHTLVDGKVVVITDPSALRLGWSAQHGLGLFVFVEMMVFIWILVLGLAYAWRKGVLKWL